MPRQSKSQGKRRRQQPGGDDRQGQDGGLCVAVLVRKWLSHTSPLRRGAFVAFNRASTGLPAPKIPLACRFLSARQVARSPRESALSGWSERQVTQDSIPTRDCQCIREVCTKILRRYRFANFLSPSSWLIPHELSTAALYQILCQRSAPELPS